jgi:type VI secretion system secreted protein VgrG
MAITLENRSLQLVTPLGHDALLPERIDIVEGLGRPFQWTLDLLSENGDLNGENILGKDVTLSFKLPHNGATRHFHGYVTEFGQVGYRQRLHEYRAIVRPWLWFLTRAANCRIFQDQTIPQIFEAVVKAHGFTDYRLKLSGTHKQWSYCVQYRETDFNFISRLLEQEGIYYYFEHSEGRHELVLCDDSTTAATMPGYQQVAYFPDDGSGLDTPGEHFSGWSLTRSVQPGIYSTSDYNFETPSLSLAAKHEAQHKHARSSFEMFDYPSAGTDVKPPDTDQAAKLRLQELQTQYLTARGYGDVAGVAPGFCFALTRHPRRDMNTDYLVTAMTLSLRPAAVAAGAGALDNEVSVSIEAIEARTPYRPPRLTPKPVVQGAQSAMVTGKSGAEIDTDKYGRVHVRFPWDRDGKHDQTSSCWVRVAQAAAGKNWGAIHIPRVGEEVLVSFLEGDPDRPIITGRVYNADFMPPYTLPENATQSGIKTRSSKDGTTDNFNEIRFEDKKGSEEFYVHAEKDLTVMVEHDRSKTVQNDETVEIKHDRKAKVGNNEKCEVTQDHETTIGNEEKRSVAKNRTTTVGSNDKLSVSEDATTDIGSKLVVTAGQQITLQTGASKLVMKSDGTIEIQGVTIKISGDQSISQKAGQSAEIKAMQVSVSGTTLELKGDAKAALEGALIDVNASAVASLKGALTKIG